MIVIPVDKYHIPLLLIKSLGQFKTTESGAYNNYCISHKLQFILYGTHPDTRLFIAVHPYTFMSENVHHQK